MAVLRTIKNHRFHHFCGLPVSPWCWLEQPVRVKGGKKLLRRYGYDDYPY